MLPIKMDTNVLGASPHGDWLSFCKWCAKVKCPASNGPAGYPQSGEWCTWCNIVPCPVSGVGPVPGFWCDSCDGPKCLLGVGADAYPTPGIWCKLCQVQGCNYKW